MLDPACTHLPSLLTSYPTYLTYPRGAPARNRISSSRVCLRNIPLNALLRPSLYATQDSTAVADWSHEHSSFSFLWATCCCISLCYSNKASPHTPCLLLGTGIDSETRPHVHASHRTRAPAQGTHHHNRHICGWPIIRELGPARAGSHPGKLITNATTDINRAINAPRTASKR